MADSKTFTLGLSKIEIGAIAEDGGMGASLAQLGYTREDSCSLTQEDPTTNEFFAEEVDDPVISISKAGKYTFAFSIMDPSVSVLADLMGGTATTASDKWDAPSGAVTIEKSVKITPKQGFIFEIPRMSIVAKWNAPLSKTDIVTIECTGTVMAPTKEGVSKLTATRISA